MGKLKDMLENLNIKLSRRGFVKSAAAAGSIAALYGCSKDDDSEIIYQGSSAVGGGSVEIQDKAPVEYFYGASGHNCGGRCITVAEVSKGRIQRFLTDEHKYTKDGTYIDPESRNFPQTRSCARCRSYKYRLYHPGRLLYPLKQTGKRGDLNGFQRISWEQSYKEIATKHRRVIEKYGIDGIYQIYACGSVSSTFNGSQSGPIGKTNGYVMKAMGGVTTQMFGSYSTHALTYFGTGYTGSDGSITSNMVAKYSKNLILWGDNSMTTGNNQSYTAIRTAEDFKKRNPDAKIIFVGPEFVDTGVTLADEWIVTKPFADQALVAGMIYHMLENTFDLNTGELKADPWLDLDYLDTMVYGFFDSPEYGLDDNTGVIDATSAHAGTRVVPAVPAGRSYCSYILGNNENAKMYSALGSSSNYTAAQFAAGSDMKRWSTCSYDGAGANSRYETKRLYTVPKTPAWASSVTGVPEEKIKELAKIYAKEGPVATRWAYAIQKQVEAISHMFAH
ncbi:MAG: molybdopterin-dependent oxidoreductase, partial [Deferribacterales bacterium]|nr:molybdopterin-dependent oxidoreductase [Deferribacterales bacterium]